MSEQAQAIIHKMDEQVNANAVIAVIFLYFGTYWQVSRLFL
ncbi:MAG: hypothetical protein ACI82S_003099 [Patiriisocius sp.]